MASNYPADLVSDVLKAIQDHTCTDYGEHGETEFLCGACQFYSFNADEADRHPVIMALQTRDRYFATDEE